VNYGCITVYYNTLRAAIYTAEVALALLSPVPRFATHFERGVHRNVHRFFWRYFLLMANLPFPDQFRRVLGLILRNGGVFYAGSRLRTVN